MASTITIPGVWGLNFEEMKFQPMDQEAREFESQYGLVPHQFAAWSDNFAVMLRFQLIDEDQVKYPLWAEAWNTVSESIKRIRRG